MLSPSGHRLCYLGLAYQKMKLPKGYHFYSLNDDTRRIPYSQIASKIIKNENSLDRHLAIDAMVTH